MAASNEKGELISNNARPISQKEQDSGRLAISARPGVSRGREGAQEVDEPQ